LASNSPLFFSPSARFLGFASVLVLPMVVETPEGVVGLFYIKKKEETQ
jgi:hypothetical protein